MTYSASTAPDVELARLLLEVADSIALRIFDTGLVRHAIKRDKTPVSTVDLCIDSAIQALLRCMRPLDAIFTEEGGRSGVPGASREWLIDPLDGTQAFLEGGTAWGTHVYLSDHGVPLLAAISAPKWGVVLLANAASPAPVCVRSDGSSQPTRLSRVLDIKGARVGGFSQPGSQMRERLRPVTRWVEPAGGPFQALMSGELDAVIDDGGRPWDMGPRAYLVTRSGGAFRDPQGGTRLDLGGGLYSNHRLADQLATLLSGTATNGIPITEWA